MIGTVHKVVDQATFIDYLKQLSPYWQEIPEIGMVTEEPTWKEREFAKQHGILDESLVAFFGSAYSRGLASEHCFELRPARVNNFQQIADIVRMGVFYE